MAVAFNESDAAFWTAFNRQTTVGYKQTSKDCEWLAAKLAWAKKT